MRVALIQRIFPAYRVGVFETLARRPGIDLTVFHGRGTRQGPWQNSSRNGQLTTVEMSTIGGRLTWGGRNYYLAYHPGLLWNLFRGKFDAVLAEGTTNFLDNLFRLNGKPVTFINRSLTHRFLLTQNFPS